MSSAPDLHGSELWLSETELRQARHTMWRHLSFNERLESAYRESQDRRYRVSRTIFFAIVTISFLLAPLLNTGLFNVTDDAYRQVIAIQWLWALPVLTLSTISPWLNITRTARYAIHVAGNLTLWGSCLALQYLSAMELLEFPLHVVSITVLAVAVFGGFRPRLITLAGTIFIALALAITLSFNHGHGYPDKLFVYETLYFWLIAIGGVITIDLLNREGWLNRKHVHLLARTDALTGLLTRGTFNQLYKRTIAMASREQQHVAVALIDLDHFKTFNDRYGHLKGDEILTQTGDALLSVEGKRPLDLLARYGGEEFIAVWYNVQPQDLDTMGQRFLDAISRLDVSTDNHDERIPVTASIGIAAGVPGRDGGDALIEAADQQLYAAKAAGRNRMHTVVVLTTDSRTRPLYSVS